MSANSLRVTPSAPGPSISASQPRIASLRPMWHSLHWSRVGTVWPVPYRLGTPAALFIWIAEVSSSDHT
jgi:hypothetical protein